MARNKADILSDLHTLVSHNVIGGKQLFNRYKGFKGELVYSRDMVDESYFEGGLIISKSSQDSCLDNAIYFTVIPDNEEVARYVGIYKALSGLEFKNMFVVQYALEDWQKRPVMEYPDKIIELPVPDFNIFLFTAAEESFVRLGDDIGVLTEEFEDVEERSRNSYPIDESYRQWLVENLSEFPDQDIATLYVTRLIFDGFIGFAKEKGKPSDIDFILKNNHGKMRLVEVKEKDLPKKAKKGFGLDVPRINDFKRMQEATGLKYFLIVRHVEDQQTRAFKEWLVISIDDFVKDVEGEGTVEGGTGMRSENSHNPTLICAYDKFRMLPIVNK